jgi:hypothetical protein
MGEDGAGPWFFVLLAAVVSIVCHLVIRRYLFAVAVAIVISVVAFQVLVRIQLGYLDMFWAIAVGTTSGAAALVANVVGIPFLLYRWKHGGVRFY